MGLSGAFSGANGSRIPPVRAYFFIAVIQTVVGG